MNIKDRYYGFDNYEEPDMPSYIGVERKGPKIFNPRPYDSTLKRDKPKQKPTNTKPAQRKTDLSNEEEVRQ